MNITDLMSEVVVKNPWENTLFKDYFILNPKTKGAFAERLVSSILEKKGYTVKRPENAGHDRIINGVKTEIKFGLTTDGNTKFETIFNHIGFKKDWDKIIFACVNGDGKIKMIQYDKSNLPTSLIVTQQGGKKSDNDDFMINGSRSAEVLQGGEVIIDDEIEGFFL